MEIKTPLEDLIIVENNQLKLELSDSSQQDIWWWIWFAYTPTKIKRDWFKTPDRWFRYNQYYTSEWVALLNYCRRNNLQNWFWENLYQIDIENNYLVMKDIRFNKTKHELLNTLNKKIQPKPDF